MKTYIYNPRKIVRSLTIGIAILFVLYFFAIASTTVNVSDAKIKNQNVQELRTELASLESTYYTMVNELSLNHAIEEGFIESNEISFAHVNQTTLVAYRN